MENLYAIITPDDKCKMINLVWNESTDAFGLYNIEKNCISNRRFADINTFTNYLDELVRSDVIINYYKVEI